MDPTKIALILDLLDRVLDLGQRLTTRPVSAEAQKEYIELRRQVRKEKVELARSLGSNHDDEDDSLEDTTPE